MMQIQIKYAQMPFIDFDYQQYSIAEENQGYGKKVKFSPIDSIPTSLLIRKQLIEIYEILHTQIFKTRNKANNPSNQDKTFLRKIPNTFPGNNKSNPPSFQRKSTSHQYNIRTYIIQSRQRIGASNHKLFLKVPK
ncbi:hypothetical protein ABPG74_004178 [Tetrahymena malaccensis]